MTRALCTAALLAGFAGLLACSGPGGVSDGAPPQTMSAAQIADAVPRPDPLLPQGNRSPYRVNGVTYTILDDYRGYEAEGLASWYGTKFHGRKTSNGEIFDLYAATAAHKSLPIPSYVEVTNLRNGKQVTVRVNDRGPFHSERLIDLSYGAAVKLGFMEQGTAPVRVRLINVAGVDDRRGNLNGDYRYLQVGAFGQQGSAIQLQREISSLVTAPVEISPVQSGDRMLYRVRVGPLADARQLTQLQDLLQARGYGAGQPLP